MSHLPLIAVAVVLAGAVYTRYGSRPTSTGVLASAYVGALVALFGLLAGGWGGVYPDQIRDSGPFAWLGQLSATPSVIFWGLVLVALVLAGLHYWAADRVRENQIGELKTSSDDLVRTLRTLPPEGFMSLFPDVCASAIEAYEVALLEADDEVARRSVRAILRSIAFLAAEFDRPLEPVTYSADVLLFLTADELGPSETWAQKMDCLYPAGFLPQRLEGGLILDPRLSTTLDNEEADPNPALRPMLLPIPKPPRDAPETDAPLGRLRVLPGAATAFVTGAFQIYEDTHQLRRDIAETHSLDEAVISACTEHFVRGPGHMNRSFVSIPLCDPSVGQDALIGVLSIECSDVSIFGGEQRTVSNFRLSISPLLYMLQRLLTLGDISPCAGMEDAVSYKDDLSPAETP